MVEVQTLVLETWTDNGRLDPGTIDASIFVCHLDESTTLTTGPLSRRDALRALDAIDADEEVRMTTLVTRRILLRVLRSFADVHAMSGPLTTRVDHHCGLLPNLLRRHPWQAWPPRAPGLYLARPRYRRCWPLVEVIDPPSSWQYRLRTFLHRRYLPFEPVCQHVAFLWRWLIMRFLLGIDRLRHGPRSDDPADDFD